MPREVDLTDPENPEWTEEMFARARPAEEILPPDVLAAAFPKMAARLRGAQRVPIKAPVSIRLDADVLDHFRKGGPGWQSRINETLRRSLKLG